MKRIYFQIAAEKAASPAARDSLAVLADLAAAYEEADALFPERINSSKAQRGEKPTRLSRSTREKLSSLEADRTALDDELARQFRDAPDDASIVSALHHAMSSELPIAEKNLKFFHPSDLSLGRDLFDRKAQLVAAMATYLDRHTAAAEPVGQPGLAMSGSP